MLNQRCSDMTRAADYLVLDSPGQANFTDAHRHNGLHRHCRGTGRDLYE